MDSDANVKVFCRVRPPNERERGVRTISAPSASAGFLARSSASAASFAKKCVTVPASDPLHQTVFLHSKHGATKTFTFDRVFGEDASQNDVFEMVGAPITQACLEGYNGTIFAYGQTGSGKTFTMQGPDDVIDTEVTSLTQEQLALRGLVPRVFDYLFTNVVAKKKRNNVQHTFACSFLEIYNERVYDLLDGGSTKDATGLQLRENGRKGVHVEGLIESAVTSSKKAAELMTVGAQNRRVGQTSMNRESSRSHSVFILQLQTKEMSAEGAKIRTSSFNLVDLAGSERQRSTDAAGERLKEAGSINKSLSALGNVILGLSERSVGKHRHVHYRDSKLTFLLKDSLGGNSKTFMVATISPAEDSAFETLSTLKFAQRAKMIQNSAVANEDSVGSVLFLQEEIQRLRRQVQQAHQEIARNIPGSNLLQQQGTALSVASSSQDDATSSQHLGSCDPVIDYRFRELEESLATTAEKNDRLHRSCEYVQVQNEHFQALCAELKQHITHLKMMLRLRGVGNSGMHEYEPSSDAIEWRMKYEEVEERLVELQDEFQRSAIEEAGVSGKSSSESKNLNMMLLGLTKQLVFVLRDKHDLQDRLLENQSSMNENMERSQEVVNSDFSTRLEEALKQQANEHQAKLDAIACLNLCLEKKAAESSLELLHVKKLKTSWSIQQHDLEMQFADVKTDLLNSEIAQSSTKEMLVKEKGKVEVATMQLERAREGIRLEFELALADASTVNQDLENSNKLLEDQLAVMTADLKNHERQLQGAKKAFDQLKVEMFDLTQANQKTILQLDGARDELKEAILQATQLRENVSDRDNTIDQLKQSEAVFIKEKILLEQKMEESNNSIKQLRKEAEVTALNHSEAIKSMTSEAEEKEHMLVKIFEKQVWEKDEQLQQLRDEFDDHRIKTDKANHLQNMMLEEKEAILTALHRQMDDQNHDAKLDLEDVQQKLSKALDDVSKLFEEKGKIETEFISAARDIEIFRDSTKKLQTEKECMTNEIKSVSELTEQLNAKTSELSKQNAELQMKCENRQIQLSESEEIIKKFTQEVESLQHQLTAKSNEAADLNKKLASAEEDNRQAVITQGLQADNLASSIKKIEALQQDIAANKDTVQHLVYKLEKAEDGIRDAEGSVSHQREEIRMYKDIHSTLLDELKKLEFDRLELTESLKTEQEAKHDLEHKFAEAGDAWEERKNKLMQHSQESLLRLGKRVSELTLSVKALSAERHQLEQANKSLDASIAVQDRNVHELKDIVANREENVRALESSNSDLVATQDQMVDEVAELRSSVHDLVLQLAGQQEIVLKQETKLMEKESVISERDDIIASLKVNAHSNEAALDLKIREYKADLDGRVQAFEQLVEEKTSVFAKAEKALVMEKRLLKQSLAEGEEILAQQTDQLMQEIKQLGLTIEDKDAQLKVAKKSVADLRDGLACSADDGKVKELQAALVKLETKYQTVMTENLSFREKTMSELKEKEVELSRRSSEVDAAEEHIKSVRKALEAQHAAADTALKEAKAKAVSQDVLGQAKRRFLTEKVKMQREIQSLAKKFETVSKENEKLVGHHNSRQKIQHHVKVKEENNRLLDQVRQLSDDKVKLQRSLEKMRMMLKEKENIGVESISDTPPSVSPALNASSSRSPSAMKVKRPSLGSTSSATAGTLASAARAAARLAARGRPRSASPGPTKKRVRTHSSGPGWQR